MRIVSLHIRNLRAISESFLEPGHDINWIVGLNGAGKTSLLEAIFIMARGRSFRSSRHGPLIRKIASELRISCRLHSHGVNRVLDFVSAGGRSRLCNNNNVIRRGRDLGKQIQVRIVTENSQRLLEGQPDVRRLFLDWNLFHVEQSYADLLANFRRVLSQRNAWLRCGASGPPVWDEEYISLADKITEFRRLFVDRLQVELDSVDTAALRVPRLHLALRQGWPEDADLKNVLAASFLTDTRRGFTRFGPARGDLLAQFDGIPGVGSRGQSKIAVILLQLGAQKVLESHSDASCIWLLDDLRAELDSERYSAIWRLFVETQRQIFVTSLEDPGLSGRPLFAESVKMFHVEHGSLVDASIPARPSLSAIVPRATRDPGNIL